MLSWNDLLQSVLEWQGEYDQWYAGVELGGGQSVEIIIAAADSRQPVPFQKVGAFIANIERSDLEFRDAIVSSLHKDYNNFWTDDAFPELSKQAFRQSLELSLISFEKDDRIEVWYHATAEDTCEDLFGGHSIIVPVEDGKPIGQAYLAG